MIEFVSGNLLEDSSEALVNTVNCVGVMGKGIALAFKAAYPENFELYKRVCSAGKLKPGGLLATEPGALFGPKQILNVATKDHWRDPSRFEWVAACATEIRRHCETTGVRSVAVPALGCSNGGLAWKSVRESMSVIFDGSSVVYRLYAPS